MKKELKLIYDVQKEVSILAGVTDLLDWDEKTHMPKKGIEGRAEQIKLIQDLIYEKLTSKKLSSAINALKKQKLSGKDAVVLKELDKQTTKLRRIPREFMKELTESVVIASSVWEKARKKNDFSIFKPELEKIIKLKIREARYINPKLRPYDVLLDDFEEGMTSEKLTELFDYLKKELVGLLDRVKQTKRFRTQKEFKIKIDQKSQEEIIKLMIGKMRLEKDLVSLDVSAHPFTTRISENDVRITTRYLNPIESFLASTHEAGHALYELGLPKNFADTIIYEAASTGLHESQSRFWENMIARSEEFWQGYFKIFREHLKKNIGWRELYYAINQVGPSFNRVNSDEITYCLHIILRFEIERDLINGRIKVDDAKNIWNKKMKEMLGITPKSDNDGILQDVHWSLGAFGYFPSYAIGTIYAAQIYKAMTKEIRDAKQDIRRQDFEKIILWLRRKIHSKGKTMPADEVIKKACSKGLDPKVFVEHLTEKYSRIYKF